MPETVSGFSPLSAATGQPARLAMQRLWLTGSVLPAGARLVVEHSFQSEEDQPLEVVYSFPLPRDAALRSFRISGDGWEAHSDLQPTADAAKIYEAGIRQGSMSVMARQYLDGLVNLSVGNLRPREVVTVHLELLAGVESHDGSYRFRFPFTLAPAYHSQAKPVRVSKGVGEIQLPRDQFGDVILPPFHQDATQLHSAGFDLRISQSDSTGGVSSPSHGLAVTAGAAGESRVALAADRDLPDRDLVLDVRYQHTGIQVMGGKGSDGRNHFTAIVPSTSFGPASTAPRNVVILLDRSGSMGGTPITQARRAIEACLAGLGPQESFALVAFDDSVEIFQPQLCLATQKNRELAGRFLSGIDARGGTQLERGIQEAARLLPKGGDILVLTDGQVFGTGQILTIARGAGARLHCLGIGSASQDRFLSLLARETGGVSRFATPDERVDMAAVELFASVGRPAASGLTASGAISPAPPRFVFSGTPVVLYGETEESETSIELRWDGGSMPVPIVFAGAYLGETVRLLRGSRLITDLESRNVEGAGAIEERQRNRIAEILVDLGRKYGLASRELSLVAVVARAGDRAGDLPETRVVPVGMPRGTAFDSYFAPGAAAGATFACMPAPPSAPMARRAGFMSRLRMPVAKAVRQPETVEDQLMALAASMEPDGGMPGRNPAARIKATLEALRKFVAEGHTPSSGAFRSHVARLVQFLEQNQLTASQQEEVDRLTGKGVVR